MGALTSCFVTTFVDVWSPKYLKFVVLYGENGCTIKTYNNDKELLKMSFNSFKMI